MKRKLLILFLLLFSVFCEAQERRITGVVKSTDGVTLIGASVLVEGTKVGAITDLNGNFSILVPEKAEKLVISYIGFLPKVQPLLKTTYFEITLVPDSKTLDQVVVVGYGTQKRTNLTGAVGVIDASALENKPITSSSQALAGKIAGVHIAQGSGIAGDDGAQITIRGLGTLNNTSPLILIDGVISNSMDVLNPSDIASISVLKDAASASIYGSQAGNGVILITTKKGTKEGKSVFNYEGSWSTSQITKNSKPKMITDPIVFMTLMNEARVNSGGLPAFSEEVIEQYRTPSYRAAASTDWFDEIVKKGVIQQHDISARGGTQKTQYFMSLGYMDQKAIILDGQYKRLTTRINIESQIASKLKVGVNFGYTYGNQRTPNGSITDFSLLSIMRGTPLNPPHTDDGYLALPDNTTLPFTGQIQSGNPLAEYESNDIREYRNNINGNMFFEFEPIKNLKLFGNFTANTNLDSYNGWFGRPVARNWRYKEIIAAPKSNESLGSLTGFYGYGRLQQQSTRSYRINPYFRAAYKFSLSKHNFSILGGISKESNNFDWISTERGRFESNYVRVFSAGDPSTIQNSSRLTKNAIVSQFGRLNYDFDNKYLFEANIRRDGSSRFGPNYRYGVFPSFSAGWVITSEPFMKKIPAINFLKIRASWGQLGNQALSDDFPYVAKISYKDANYVWGNTVFTGARADSYGNPDLHWETTTMSDIGLNLHLFNSSVQFEFDYFDKKSTGILYNTPLPLETGFSSVFTNLASVRNKGIEGAVSFSKKFNKLTVDVGINASRITNKILSINPDVTGETDRYIKGEKILTRNSPIDAYYLVKWTGRIFQSKEEVDQLPHQFGAAPGDLIFEDFSGPDGKPDGVIDAYDRQILGTQYPSWTYGGNINLRYGSFGLSADFQGIADAYSYGSHEYFYPTFQGSNIAEHWLNRWTPDRPSLTTPRVWVDNGPNTDNFNTYFLMNRSYLRLRNLLVSYELPKKLIEKVSLQNLKVYMSASNLFTWTNYQGFDPERKREANSRGGLPQTMIMKFGLTLTF
ncbi:SusC/RagA family TonB-linked outer membrane protein [Pedobacter endophyticus]|uniref:TonB-dependent receptor n=1 Tax=Pedobacter endophyticus TaxID=2789740 RepID=A0A7U3SNY4_9SPHI|nr:TonB-dependent receptor [Pedobacter endophyticus]QPH37853.1 TonB-dependent receptor [Pedobacter endophyticus]